VNWIVVSTVIQADQANPFVPRRFTIDAPTRADAAELIRKMHGGYISVIGYTRDGKTHYFAAPAQYA
jgi:hypothetical protein